MEFSEHPSNQIQPPTFERVATGKTRRYLVAAALVGGGVTLGAVFSPIGLAGAQTSDEETESVGAAQESDGDATDGDATDGDATDGDDATDDGHRHGRRHGRLENLTEIIGLSADELRERFADGQTLAEVAEEQGISTDDLVAEMVAAVTERVNDAVAEDRIDADQAAERLAGAEERIENFINREGGQGRGEGRGHGGEGRGGRHADRGVHLGEAVEALGITQEDVEAGRAEGKTLAEIAGEQGVSEQDLVDALVAEITESIDEALAEGKIDAEQAEEKKASIEERVSERVNATPGERSGEGRHGRRGHHRGNGSADGTADGSADTDGETGETSYSA